MSSLYSFFASARETSGAVQLAHCENAINGTNLHFQAADCGPPVAIPIKSKQIMFLAKLCKAFAAYYCGTMILGFDGSRL